MGGATPLAFNYQISCVIQTKAVYCGIIQHTQTMQHVMQRDDVRDLAINCTSALEDKGLVPTLTEDGDQSSWEVQDTIEEVLTKLLTERHGIAVVNDRVQ